MNQYEITIEQRIPATGENKYDSTEKVFYLMFYASSMSVEFLQKILGAVDEIVKASNKITVK